MKNNFEEKSLTHDNTEWTESEYKNGLRIVNLMKDDSKTKSILTSKINKFPDEQLKNLFQELPNKEYGMLPFRVFGNATDQPQLERLSISDLRLNSFTLFNKHAYVTLFIFVMSDPHVRKEEFKQIALERMYSRKKGYGAKLLEYMIKKAKKHDVTLTVWCENDKLKEYYVKQGFTFEYRSLKTGDYFLTFNLK